MMRSFRPLTDADHPLLRDWLQRPHVKEWWDDGDNTLAKVAQHYSRDPGRTKRFFLQIDGGGFRISAFVENISDDVDVARMFIPNASIGSDLSITTRPRTYGVMVGYGF